MPLAILGLTTDGVVFASNPSARELLGAEAGCALPADDDAWLDAVGELCRQAGEDVRIVERAGAGGQRRFRAAGIDLPGLVEGAPARLLVVEDLTDAVRSEPLAAWAEMARRIAHEIKNPLTPISLVVEHVQRLIHQTHVGRGAHVA